MAARINWLVSYPKSGNTWMRMLLANYFGDSEDAHDINAPDLIEGVAASRRLFDNHLGLASSDLTDDEALSLRPALYRHIAAAHDQPIWMKVHDSQHRLPDGTWLFPPEASGHAVYVVRDPRDVAVSNAFHHYDGDMARAVRRLCDADATLSGRGDNQMQQRLGDWSTHVRSWTDQNVIPVLVVRYEDMLADTANALLCVLERVRPAEPPNRERIALAVRHSNFDALRAAEWQSGFRETAPQQRQFFRSGTAGDWRNHLLPDQAAQIVATHVEVMTRFGYGPDSGGDDR